MDYVGGCDDVVCGGVVLVVDAMTVALIVVSVFFGAFVIATLIYCAYAAGWNASVDRHRNREPGDPCWEKYL